MKLDAVTLSALVMAFAWTMAFTHEDGWLGPYFSTREWVAHPPGR